MKFKVWTFLFCFNPVITDWFILTTLLIDLQYYGHLYKTNYNISIIFEFGKIW